MKTEHQDVKERYEQPVVLDIAPVTANVVRGVDSTIVDEPEEISNG